MKLSDSRENPAVSSLLIIIGLFLIGFLVVGSIVQILVMLAVGASLTDLMESAGDFSKLPNAWLGMILGQGLGSFIGFVGSAWLYWRIIEKKTWQALNFEKIPALPVFGMVVMIQMAFMGFNGWLQEINQAIVFPESLKGLEAILKGMEDKLAETTKFFTDFKSFGQFILAFLVIAVIAGVGEELIFRGLIMRKLLLGTRNHHVAIWVAAFIFAVIHFQFYGIIPRMMLGVLFGYFYYWTGNILVPIFAHIFNNGFAVTVMYLHNLGIVKTDLESMDDVPTSIIAFSLIATIGLMFLLKNYTSNRPSADNNQI
ncbi:Abortive infection protein [Emticicia oligotrophica DSM 17448]|uniref:Abortive infection protein n=1 Tax=Emticicia oligotrophica (strain DSM 17448 / CIP 109782 / MTCC 6937 / GPTSA100-15) TaxID=929562 RepID=A0ABM5MX64_EMTOG|nr:CPBP family intramembrane glutamic endopeptidase [Emticicia oligotrophica]AFK01708.1 Abortive infection protein [Emticicia oligotrophica DSM 17448]